MQKFADKSLHNQMCDHMKKCTQTHQTFILQNVAILRKTSNLDYDSNLRPLAYHTNTLPIVLLRTPDT